MSAEILHFYSVNDALNRIRELRLAATWSQQRLADAINVSKVTISDLERGQMQLTLDYMRRIATALHCSPADLLPLTDHPYALSDEERAMIDRMRAGAEDDRKKLRQLADVVIPMHSPAADESDAA